MQSFKSRKNILKVLWISIVIICVLAIFRVVFILFLFKEENFEKFGNDVTEFSKIFSLNNKVIIPDGIIDFYYLHKKRGWYSSIFWNGFLDEKSFEEFIKTESLIKIKNPPIYDFVVEEEFGLKISKPYEVYESKHNRNFIYIYDNSKRIIGIYTSK